MTASRHTLLSTSRLRGIVLASVLASAFGACSLNPQPIPPGFDNEEGSGGTTGSDGGKAPPVMAADAASSLDNADGALTGDAGGGPLKDATPPPGPSIDASSDAGPEVGADADVAPDGSSDASFDGPGDALAD